MNESTARAVAALGRDLPQPVPSDVIGASMRQVLDAAGLTAAQARLVHSLTPPVPPSFLSTFDQVFAVGKLVEQSALPQVGAAFAAMEAQRQRELAALTSTLRMPTVDFAEVLKVHALAVNAAGPAIAQVAEMRSVLAPLYRDALAAIRPVMPDMARAVAALLRTEFDTRSWIRWTVAAELRERSWWLCPTWDDDFLRRLLQAIDGRRGQRALVEFLTKHYRRDRYRALRQMVDSWTLPELVERRRFLKEAVRLYREGRFGASLKVMTGFEEAVVKEALLRKQRITPADARKRKAPALLKLHVTRGRAALVPFESAFTAMFTEFTWGARWRGSDVQRHRIAHGGVPQDRAALPLRMFLVLATLDHYLGRLK